MHWIQILVSLLSAISQYDDPGALVNVRMSSRAGVLLDELPVGYATRRPPRSWLGTPPSGRIGPGSESRRPSTDWSIGTSSTRTRCSCRYPHRSCGR